MWQRVNRVPVQMWRGATCGLVLDHRELDLVAAARDVARVELTCSVRQLLHALHAFDEE